MLPGMDAHAVDRDHAPPVPPSAPPHPFPMQISSGGRTEPHCEDMCYAMDFDERGCVKLTLWLSGAFALRALQAGEAWMLMRLTKPVALRFRFVQTWLNRAVFEAAEVRQADDPALHRPDVVWLPLGLLSTPRAAIAAAHPSASAEEAPARSAG